MNKKVIALVVVIIVITSVIYYVGDLGISPKEYSGKLVNFDASKGGNISIEGKDYTLRGSDDEFFYLMPTGKDPVPLFPEEKIFKFPWNQNLFILEEKILGPRNFSLGDNSHVEFELSSSEPVTVIVTPSKGEVGGVIFFGVIVWIVLFCISIGIIF